MSEDNILKDIVVPICAITGATIGIWNFVVAIVERRSGDRRKDDDDLRFIKFCHDRKSVNAGFAYEPEVGTESHLWAERMVDRRKFTRMDHGLYEINVHTGGDHHFDDN